MDEAIKPVDDREELEKAAETQKLTSEQVIKQSLAQQSEEAAQLEQRWTNPDQLHQMALRDVNRNTGRELKHIPTQEGMKDHNDPEGMSRLNQKREDMLDKCGPALDEVVNARSDHSQQSREYDEHINSYPGASPTPEHEQVYTREQTPVREIEHVYELIR